MNVSEPLDSITGISCIDYSLILPRKGKFKYQRFIANKSVVYIQYDIAEFDFEGSRIYGKPNILNFLEKVVKIERLGKKIQWNYVKHH